MRLAWKWAPTFEWCMMEEEILQDCKKHRGRTQHLIPSLWGGSRSPWASLILHFFAPPSSRLLTHTHTHTVSLGLSTFAVSWGRVQSEALWPIRQLRGRAPLLSFPFRVCLCNLSRVHIRVERLGLTPHRAGYTYLHSRKSSSWAFFTRPLYLP